eukprot:1160445-Pelagomonas_calceolata.AAC.8
MSAADSWGALAICFLSKGNFSYFPIPGITACLQYGWGHCSHHLTSHFALGISLAKSGNQVPGVQRESNFLAGPGLGIVVGKFFFWSGPKLVAKVWKHEGGCSLCIEDGRVDSILQG